MTKQKQEVVIPEPAAMLDGYTPLYVLQDQDVEEAIYKIIGTGEPVFYVLAMEKETLSYKEKNVTKYNTSFSPRVWKVTSNLAGMSIRPMVDLDKAAEFDATIGTLEKKAQFRLPRIPRQLIEEIDQFFRFVHQKQQTESIVMLTYNPEKEGDDRDAGLGWGYEVPTQKNTSGYCDYNPDSVIEVMDDEAFIAGSAHSHPGMSAFCSGTDKKDQEGFDGIHITYGWGEKKTDDPTKTNFHIELQMGGAAYSMTPDQAFGPKEQSDSYDFSDVEDRIEKGKVVQSTYGSWEGYPSYQNYHNTGSSTAKQDDKKDDKKTTGGNKKITRYFEPTKQITAVDPVDRPEDLLGIDFSLSGEILVCAPLEAHDKITVCMACGNEIDAQQREHFRCRKCLSYFHGMDHDFEHIYEKRKDYNHLTTAGLQLLENQYQNVWYWLEEWDGENKQLLDKVELLIQGKGSVPKAFQGKK